MTPNNSPLKYVVLDMPSNTLYVVFQFRNRLIDVSEILLYERLPFNPNGHKDSRESGINVRGVCIYEAHAERAAASPRQAEHVRFAAPLLVP